jgi:hypothetical protein
MNERFVYYFSEKILNLVPETSYLEPQITARNSMVTKAKHFLKKTFFMTKTSNEEEKPLEAPILMSFPLFKLFKSIDKMEMVSKTIIED